MSQMPPRRSSLWEVLDERLGLGALRYPVPRHANTLWHCLGALTLIAFGVLVVTGFILALYYNPLPEQANHSVRHIVGETGIGGFVRGLHYWAAQLMVVTLLLHLGRVFLTASYRRPREVNWLIGVLLLLVTVGIYFSGSILKWDQEAYEAMLHNMEGARFLGALGFLFSEFTRSVPMLVRLYLAHVSILPALLTLLVIAHFFLVKRHGISPSPWGASGAAPGEETFARHLHQRVGGFGLLLLGALTVLAVLLPPSLGPAPVEGIEVTKPPWLFLPFYTLENLVGLTGLLYAPLALVLLLALVPFVDRSGPIHPRARRGVLAVAIALVLLAVASGLWAWWSTPVAHVGM